MANALIVGQPNLVAGGNLLQISVAGQARGDFRHIARRGKLRSANQPLAGFPVPVVDNSGKTKGPAIEIREGKRVKPQAEVNGKVGANFPLVLHVSAPVSEGLVVTSVLVVTGIGQAEQHRSEFDPGGSRAQWIVRLDGAEGVIVTKLHIAEILPGKLQPVLDIVLPFDPVERPAKCVGQAGQCRVVVVEVGQADSSGGEVGVSEGLHLAMAESQRLCSSSSALHVDKLPVWMLRVGESNFRDHGGGEKMSPVDAKAAPVFRNIQSGFQAGLSPGIVVQ